jgi:hypothetical protein
MSQHPCPCLALPRPARDRAGQVPVGRVGRPDNIV